jgi:hypothetical protein
MAVKKAPGTRTPRTRELYDRLLEAFRERPGNPTYAARQAGVSWKTANTAWERGWDGIVWARPLMARIADEGDEAEIQASAARNDRERERKVRLEAQDADRERARQDRVKSLAEDNTLLLSATRGAQQIASSVLALAPVAAQCVRVAMRDFFDEGVGLDGKPTWTPKATTSVTGDQALKFLARIGIVSSRVALMTDALVRLKDERRGPEDRVGAPEMSEEDLDEEAKALEDLLRVYRDQEQIVRDAQVALETGHIPPREDSNTH